MAGSRPRAGRVGIKWGAGTITLALTLVPGFAPHRVFAAGTGRPAPATRPAGELDWKKAATTIDTLGDVWFNIHAAVDRNDLDTAAELTQDLIKQAEGYRDKTQVRPWPFRCAWPSDNSTACTRP